MCQENERVGMLFLEGIFLEEKTLNFPQKTSKTQKIALCGVHSWPGNEPTDLGWNRPV